MITQNLKVWSIKEYGNNLVVDNSLPHLINRLEYMQTPLELKRRLIIAVVVTVLTAAIVLLVAIVEFNAFSLDCKGLEGKGKIVISECNPIK